MAITAYKDTPWDLSDLFPSVNSPEIKDALNALEKNTARYEGYREELSPDMDIEDFYEIIDLGEKIILQVGKLTQYAFLNFSADTRESNASTFLGKVQQLSAEVGNRTLFFSLWWRGLDDGIAEKFLMRAGPYEYYLRNLRNFRPYTLSEPEEKIINIKDVTGSAALKNIFDAITNRLTFKLLIDGQPEAITQGELLQYVYSADGEMRAAAYQELLNVYSQEGPILGLIYQNYARDYCNEYVNLRGMKRPIAFRNLANDIPDEIVDTLLETARKNAHVFQRYFKLKARWLKVDKIRRYDVYAPVTTEETKKYEFDDAAQMVLEAFREFEPQTEELARKVLDENHIDSQVRKGKMSGAYNYGVDPALTPFVLMNYNGQARDIATLAHELGHSIHNLLAAHHTPLNFGAPLPLAETASTFAEMLLTDKLLAEESDENVRRDILFAQVDDAFATILRQCYFAMFEIDAHDAILGGASVDELCEIYFENLQEQFGDSLELSEDFKWEWVYISHFFDRPFYVYAYAFGQLLVLSLYKQYRREGKSFVPRFLDILAAGGSMAPVEILDKAGIDIRDNKFWQGGFDVIAEMVNQLEELPVN